MPKYIVDIKYSSRVVLEVEADNAEEAEDQARSLALSEPIGSFNDSDAYVEEIIEK